VTRRDQHRTPVEAELLRLTTRRVLTSNSKPPDPSTLAQRAGLPSQHQTGDDPSAHHKSRTCNSQLCPQRMHDTSKILKTP
jgi:hypothetical protein